MFFNKPTAAAVRKTELAEAEMQLVQHQKQLDYYEATTVMLKKRISRLQNEVSQQQNRTTRVGAAHG